MKNNTTLTQQYEAYTRNDFRVWKQLFERQMLIVNQYAVKEYLEGIRVLGFKAEAIPDFAEVNRILSETTGWRVEAVNGLIQKKGFFRMLAQKRFPATTWLRKLNQLDYLPEPDMFHDVFGHLPLLTNKRFTDFYQSIGELGIKYNDHKEILNMLERFYWFTVEFGLLHSEDNLRVYGAGILSSSEEVLYSVSETPTHLPFDIGKVIHTCFDKSIIQDTYFVIASFEELYDSVEELETILGEMVQEGVAYANN